MCLDLSSVCVRPYCALRSLRDDDDVECPSVAILAQEMSLSLSVSLSLSLVWCVVCVVCCVLLCRMLQSSVVLCRMLQSSDDASPSVAILAQETSVRFSRQAPNTLLTTRQALW